MPGATPTVLEVAGVVVRFEGVVALDGVSLTVRANQIVGVIGPNGAGKTTLFNAVSRFVMPSTGTITFQGQPLLGMAAGADGDRTNAAGPRPVAVAQRARERDRRRAFARSSGRGHRGVTGRGSSHRSASRGGDVVPRGARSCRSRLRPG